MIAERRQIARDGERSRPAADQRDALAVLLLRRLRQPRRDVVLVVGGHALQAADRHRLVFHAHAPAGRLARPVAGAPEHSRKHVRIPIDHVGVGIAARRDQPDVFGNGRMRRTSPLAIHDLVEVVGRGNVGILHSLLETRPSPASPQQVQEACRCRVTASGGWYSPGAALLGRPRFRGRNIWGRTPQGYLSFRRARHLSTASFRSCFSLPERGGSKAGERQFCLLTLMFLPAEPAIFRPKPAGSRRAAALIAAHNHAILMRDIFTEIFENQPLDPREAARRGGAAGFAQAILTAGACGRGGRG